MKDTLLYLRHEILGVQRTSKEGDSWNNQEATAEYYAKIRRIEEDLREAKGPLMESLYGAREKEEGEGTMAPLYVHSDLSVSDNEEQVPVAWEEQTGSSATSACCRRCRGGRPGSGSRPCAGPGGSRARL